MRRTLLHKYGGTSVGTVRRVGFVAEQLVGISGCGFKVVAILSAMGGETNRLVEIISQTASIPRLIAVDFTISAGEQISVGLLSVALWQSGTSNLTLTGGRSGLCTEGLATNSAIEVSCAESLRESQLLTDVVIVTGFQGISPGSDITTLGRGGSDTSASALSVVVGGRCSILTDVLGIHTADPRIRTKTKLLGRMTLEEVTEMACHGSKVVHPRSMLLAGRHSNDMSIISSLVRPQNRKARTDVLFLSTKIGQVERPIATSISYRKDRTLTILRTAPQSENLRDILTALLNREPFEHEVAGQFASSSHTFVSFVSEHCRTREIESLVLKQTRSFLSIRSSRLDSRISELSVIGLGLRLPGFVIGAIVGMGVRIKSLAFSGIRLTFLLAKCDLLGAVGKLHYHFFGE